MGRKRITNPSTKASKPKKARRSARLAKNTVVGAPSAPSTDMTDSGLNLPFNPVNAVPAVWAQPALQTQCVSEAVAVAWGPPTFQAPPSQPSTALHHSTAPAALGAPPSQGAPPSHHSTASHPSSAPAALGAPPSQSAWTSAFLIYASIYLSYHPHRTQGILKYMHTVRSAASRFGGYGWRQYDINFRMRQQRAPQRSWSLIDGELWYLFCHFTSHIQKCIKPELSPLSG